jgi:hypothetical protein
VPLTRRSVFAAGLAASVASSAVAQTPPKPSPTERLLELARLNLRLLQWDGATPSGPGWDFLKSESQASEFVLLGEQHGIAEVPSLATALFRALRPAGFDRLIIETSGPTASALDLAARGGIAGIERFHREHAPGAPFYGWRPEAQFLADVRAMIPGNETAFWGIDYEIFWQDRYLIGLLKARAPAPAAPAMRALERAANEAFARFGQSKDFTQLYGISGDVRLIDNLRAAWGSTDPESDLLLTTLKETVEINRLFLDRQGFASNQRRAANMRANLIRYLRQDEAAGQRSKALLKMGIEHAARGVNDVGGYDIGTLLPEVAALRGGHAFSLMVIGGKDARHGQIDPAAMKTNPQPLNDLADFGLDILAPALPTTGVAVLDLRPLRRVATGDKLSPRAARCIHGYDALVVWNGSTPTTDL